MENINLTKYFLDGSKNDKEFKSILLIIKKISSENIWVIGSYVSKTIIEKLYGTKKNITDYDFIVEKLHLEKLPKNIKLEYNSFGQPRLIYKNTHIDVVELSEVYCIKTKLMLPLIENYFWGTLLNTQAIAFDYNKKEIIGDLGISSILAKEVKINNEYFIENYFSKPYFIKRDIKAKDYVLKHAKTLDFKPIF